MFNLISTMASYDDDKRTSLEEIKNREYRHFQDSNDREYRGGPDSSDPSSII